jgi:hypothetical protein
VDVNGILKEIRQERRSALKQGPREEKKEKLKRVNLEDLNYISI